MRSNRLKFGTIVVATDLKDTASSALLYAQAIARLHESTLVVVHVVDPVGYAFPRGGPESLARDQAARDELKKIEDDIRRQRIPVHSIVGSGVICERILQTLNDHHADLLVLGTRGKTAGSRVALQGQSPATLQRRRALFLQFRRMSMPVCHGQDAGGMFLWQPTFPLPPCPHWAALTGLLMNNS